MASAWGRRQVVWRGDCHGPAALAMTGDGNRFCHGMACPKDGKATIRSLGWAHEGSALSIATIELLGSTGKVTWTQGANALDVTLPSDTACKYAYALKVTPVAK